MRDIFNVMQVEMELFKWGLGKKRVREGLKKGMGFKLIGKPLNVGIISTIRMSQMGNKFNGKQLE